MCVEQSQYIYFLLLQNKKAEVQTTTQQTAHLLAQEDDVGGLAGFGSSFPVQLSDFIGCQWAAENTDTGVTLQMHIPENLQCAGELF